MIDRSCLGSLIKYVPVFLQLIDWQQQVEPFSSALLSRVQRSWGAPELNLLYALLPKGRLAD